MNELLDDLFVEEQSQAQLVADDVDEFRASLRGTVINEPLVEFVEDQSQTQLIEDDVDEFRVHLRGTALNEPLVE